jgi:glycosyltransferase involved in cell wall biosynthesis
VRPETSTTLEKWIYRYWLPHILPKVEAVITISEQSRRDITKYLPVEPEKVTVTKLAASRNFLVMPDDEVIPVLKRHQISYPYILYVGSIEPRKNLLRLLEAYRQLRLWSTKWRLVIIGARNYWKSSPVMDHVAEFGLEQCVRFTGYVPDEDLPALYNGADLFVFPSLYEGFGLPVLEAMACGTPVVTSNSSSLPEVAGDAALLVDPYDVEAIAAAMVRVLADPDLAEALRQKGLRRAGEFTWERTARETIAVYEQVLANQPRNPA